jgi:hypothetical protein
MDYMEQLSWLLFFKSFEETEKRRRGRKDQGHDRGGAGEGVSGGSCEH